MAVPLFCKQVSVPLLMSNIKFGLCSDCILLAGKVGTCFVHIIATLSGLLFVCLFFFLTVSV